MAVLFRKVQYGGESADGVGGALDRVRAARDCILLRKPAATTVRPRRAILAVASVCVLERYIHGTTPIEHLRLTPSAASDTATQKL